MYKVKKGFEKIGVQGSDFNYPILEECSQEELENVYKVSGSKWVTKVQDNAKKESKAK